jgi:hypothetical protein
VAALAQWLAALLVVAQEQQSETKWAVLRVPLLVLA